MSAGKIAALCISLIAFVLAAAGLIVVVLRRRAVRHVELRDERSPFPDPIFETFELDNRTARMERIS
jgi:hypothetical protein